MKKGHVFQTKTEKETRALGQRMACYLIPGDIICLFGELGSGKTTFVKGLAEGLKIKPVYVHSPTYVLMNFYEGTLSLYHFDLYRLENIRDMRDIGFDEFLYTGGIAVVEWAERMKGLMPENRLDVHFIHQHADKRTITLSPQGSHYRQVIKKLSVIS